MLGALCLLIFFVIGITKIEFIKIVSVYCNCYLSSEYCNSIYIIYILIFCGAKIDFFLYLLDIVSSHIFSSYQGKYSAIM